MKVEKDEFLLDDGNSVMITMRRAELSAYWAVERELRKAPLYPTASAKDRPAPQLTSLLDLTCRQNWPNIDV